jgi:hypothetical protein
MVRTKLKHRMILCLLLLTGFLWIPAHAGFAAPGEQPVPSGFELVRSAQGVAIYKKAYPNGSPDYVQVADLSLGGQVRLLHGEIAVPGQGAGVYGGDNPRFNRKSIKQFWNELSSSIEGAFCVSNGQFFRLADSPSPLPFPLKVDGQVLTDGYGIQEFPDQKLMLEIWPDRMDIRELTKENLYSSSAPDIVAGLTEDAEKASKKAVGRTFVGLADRDGDRQFEVLYIFNTQVARPSAAADVLRSFGAERVMMLDGGGSTQLVCQDEVYINTDRLIPQAIGIAAGSLPPYAASLASQNETPLIVAGEPQNIPVVVRNKGSETWQPADTQVLVEGSDKRLRASISLLTPVSSGEQATINWQIPAIDQSGLQRVKISLAYQGEIFPLPAGEFDLLVLPPVLMDKAAEIQAKLAEWSGQPGLDLAAQVQGWLYEQQAQPVVQTQQADIQASAPAVRKQVKIEFSDIVWIPLLMIPIVALMMAVIRQSQQSFS